MGGTVEQETTARGNLFSDLQRLFPAITFELVAETLVKAIVGQIIKSLLFEGSNKSDELKALLGKILIEIAKIKAEIVAIKNDLVVLEETVKALQEIVEEMPGQVFSSQVRSSLLVSSEQYENWVDEFEKTGSSEQAAFHFNLLDVNLRSLAASSPIFAITLLAGLGMQIALSRLVVDGDTSVRSQLAFLLPLLRLAISDSNPEGLLADVSSKTSEIANLDQWDEAQIKDYLIGRDLFPVFEGVKYETNCYFERRVVIEGSVRSGYSVRGKWKNSGICHSLTYSADVDTRSRFTPAIPDLEFVIDVSGKHYFPEQASFVVPSSVVGSTIDNWPEFGAKALRYARLVDSVKRLTAASDAIQSSLPKLEELYTVISSR